MYKNKAKSNKTSNHQTCFSCHVFTVYNSLSFIFVHVNHRIPKFTTPKNTDLAC